MDPVFACDGERIEGVKPLSPFLVYCFKRLLPLFTKIVQVAGKVRKKRERE